jgi:hypothetical protein
VRDWEQGAHRPDKAAQVLLTVVAKDSGAVARGLESWAPRIAGHFRPMFNDNVKKGVRQGIRQLDACAPVAVLRKPSTFVFIQRSILRDRARWVGRSGSLHAPIGARPTLDLTTADSGKRISHFERLEFPKITIVRVQRPNAVLEQDRCNVGDRHYCRFPRTAVPPATCL